MTATMLYNFGAALLRAGGDTQRPLYFLFAAGVVNVVLNLVFVIKLPDGCGRCGPGHGDLPVHFRRTGDPLPDEGNRSSAAGSAAS